jgi:deazaflavin-dependent oxidoreductase (nitroreductase family)
MANPDTTIQIGPEVREVRARLANDQERNQLWKKMVATYPGYDFYERNAKGRKIPVVILDPRRPIDMPTRSTVELPRES